MSIAEGSTFMNAALDYDTTQSSFSKAIFRLEEELKVPLFDRSHYPVVLTGAGKQLYEDIKALEPGIKKLCQHINSFSTRQDISCCVVPSFAHFGLQYIFDRFAEIHPTIPLNLTKCSDPLVAARKVQKGELDFCITHKPFKPKPGLRFTEFADDELIVILPRSKYEHSSELGLQDIAGETLLTTEWSHCILRDLKEVIPIPPITEERKQARSDIIDSISLGYGAALYYRSDMENFNCKNISVYPLKDFPRNPMGIASVAEKRPTTNQMTFRIFLLSHLQRKARG
jgi:DNA-binding transcriptional LysR family regulator